MLYNSPSPIVHSTSVSFWEALVAIPCLFVQWDMFCVVARSSNVIRSESARLQGRINSCDARQAGALRTQHSTCVGTFSFFVLSIFCSRTQLR